MTDYRPLVVVTDEVVLDEILRLAAAVGCEVDRAADLRAARPQWTRAPLVIVDEQAVLGADPPPRRRGVLLACKGTLAADSWPRVFQAGVGQVVALPDDEADLVAALAESVEGPARHGRVLAVLGGRGGAGASVLAASVGLGAARAGGQALLVDGDPLGGGADLVLGMEHDEGARWPELRVTSGRVSMVALREALPARRHGTGSLAVLSCGRGATGPACPSATAVAAVVEAGRRAGHLVICDLPRHSSPAVTAALDRADLVLVVVPAELRACAAATRLLDEFADHRDRAGLVVRLPSPDRLGEDQIAASVGAPLLATMRWERELSRAVERGSLEQRGKPLAPVVHTILNAVGFDPAEAVGR